MSWLASWLLNPLMMGVGAAAVASPIIIHLLNKRRFRIVEWAAMDFLLEADKKNRRRVRLENFILLMLRCLAMFLLGLMLARPFLPSQLAGILGQTREFEHIVVLDDSLSQQIVVGNETAFDASRERIRQLLQSWAGSESRDWLTLYVTSSPVEPFLSNEPVTPETLDVLLTRVDELPCSQTVARYVDTLAEVESYVRENRTGTNRTVTVFTDLRKRDWEAEATESESETAAHRQLAAINEQVADTRLVDVGAAAEDNLAVTDIRVTDLLVANATSRFSVSVTNFGRGPATDVDVAFRVGDGQPQTQVIPRIPAGESRSATFLHRFVFDQQAWRQLDLQQRLRDILLNERVVAEITSVNGAADVLAEDSRYVFAANALKGLPVLLVDGDPSPDDVRRETWYLSGLEVPGTGVMVDIVTAAELESLSLSQYRVIFLCNVDEVSTERVSALQQWVREGGGLVFMPGDRVRAETFNSAFFETEGGLSPLRLEAIEGDVSQMAWSDIEVRAPDYPPLSSLKSEGVDLGAVKIFSWWNATVPESEAGKSVRVALTLSNTSRSPLMAERRLGEGRVVCFAIPADGDWSTWPAHPTYVPVMWDLVNEMAADSEVSQRRVVGSPLRRVVELTAYERDVEVIDPENEKRTSRAQPIDDGAIDENEVLYRVEFPQTQRSGFWQMSLRRKDGSVEKELYAINVDSAESDLKRLDTQALPSEYFGKTTRLLNADEVVLAAGTGSGSEIWMQVLFALAAVLGLEQFLAWWFGRKR